MLPDAANADADMNADRTGFDFVLMNANVPLDENHIPVFVVPGLLTWAGQHWPLAPMSRIFKIDRERFDCSKD